MSKHRKQPFRPFHSSILAADFKEINQDKATAAKSLQSWSTLCDPMDCSPPGSSVHGILQARVLEGVAMLCSRGSSRSRHGTCISYIFCIGRQVLYH